MSDSKSSGAPCPSPVRVYMDGCFDIMHSGHYNALRQAKTLGDVLVAGVHSCEEILRNKGPTVMGDEERMELVRACKWVDEAVFDTPYSPSVQLLDKLNCHFAVHGDDISTSADGTDAFAVVRDAGRLKIFKRTEGISTTDLMGRLLLRSKEAHDSPADLPAPPSSLSKFLATSYRLAQFSNKRVPAPNDLVVYVAASFDLFHVGHVEVLKAAKALTPQALGAGLPDWSGQVFVYAGIYDDEMAWLLDPHRRPVIMDLQERVLNVLACKYVDEVIIGAPPVITKEMITVLNLKAVVVPRNPCEAAMAFVANKHAENPLHAAQAAGIVVYTDFAPRLTTDGLVQRILDNRKLYEDRTASRSKKELAYKENRTYVSEL